MTRLRIDQIRLDGGTQMRVGPRNPEALLDYKTAIQEGAALPPVVVFHDGDSYWLADGFHRWSAHKELDLRDIEADVREGAQRDAVLYSVGANASHGLRRTNADKRRAVETLLKDEEWAKWSDREIAGRCGVGNKFVGDVRRSICHPMTDRSHSGNGGQPPICVRNTDAPTERTVQRGGTTYVQQTGNIGQRTKIASDVPTQVSPTQTVHSVGAAATPPTSVPEVEVLRPVPRIVPNVTPPTPSILEAESQPVFQAEDLYIPFHDPEPARKSREEVEKGVRDIHNALERLLKHERDGRSLMATPDPYTRSVRDLARHARDMLDDWLDGRSEQDAKTITIDALN